MFVVDLTAVIVVQSAVKMLSLKKKNLNASHFTSWGDWCE